MKDIEPRRQQKILAREMLMALIILLMVYRRSRPILFGGEIEFEPDR